MNFRSRFTVRAAGFQLAAMFDIAFLLVCFSIASQIYARWEEEIDITLPTAETAEPPRRLRGEIILNIRRDGAVIFNMRQLTEREIGSLLRRVVREFRDQPVLIRADGKTDYENVVRVLDLCRQARVWNIRFATGIRDRTPEKRGSVEKSSEAAPADNTSREELRAESPTP